MSKLKVKRSKQISETIQLSLTKGSKLNHERCLQQPEVDNCNCLKERGVLPKDFYICKILYPHQTQKKYPECDHANDFTPNRDMWTHKKYSEYLSIPKKLSPSSMPKWIRKNISPANVHVQKLAQPRKNMLLDTFKTHSKHLSMIKIETLLTRLYDANFMTPQQAMSEMKQKLCEKQKKVKQQKSDIRRLQKKIKKCNEFNNLAENLTKSFREFMTKNRRVVDACDESEDLSKFVHDRLSHMFKSPRVDKNTADVVDNVLHEFSNKIASCMRDILKNTSHQLQSHSETNDKCLQQFKKLCLPIDDFYPPEILAEKESLHQHRDSNDDEETDESDVSTASLEQTQVNFEDKKLDELSFLRRSQINISPAECEKLQEDIKRIEAALNDGTMKKSASQKSLKTAKDVESAEDTDGTKTKKKKSKKKKKAKKVNLKCFGNLNPKPQWAVEWNAKDNGNNDDDE